VPEKAGDCSAFGFDRNDLFGTRCIGSRSCRGMGVFCHRPAEEELIGRVRAAREPIGRQGTPQSYQANAYLACSILCWAPERIVNGGRNPGAPTRLLRN
jgi:hypothetical protein